MKDNQDLLSFYLDGNETDKEIQELVNSGFYRALQDAPLKTKTLLQRLCNRDEDCMRQTIRDLLRLSIVRKIDTYQKRVRRQPQKNKSKQKNLRKDKTRKDFYQAIALVKFLEPSIDADELRKRADERVDHEGLEFPGLLNQLAWKKAQAKPGKTNVLFNGVLCKIFKRARDIAELSDNDIYEHMAKLLTCLKIKKLKGNNYARTDIRSIVNPSKTTSSR